jgi:hypothetical protein
MYNLSFEKNGLIFFENENNTKKSFDDLNYPQRFEFFKRNNQYGLRDIITGNEVEPFSVDRYEIKDDNEFILLSTGIRDEKNRKTFTYMLLKYGLPLLMFCITFSLIYVTYDNKFFGSLMLSLVPPLSSQYFNKSKLVEKIYVYRLIYKDSYRVLNALYNIRKPYECSTRGYECQRFMEIKVCKDFGQLIEKEIDKIFFTQQRPRHFRFKFCKIFFQNVFGKAKKRS